MFPENFHILIPLRDTQRQTEFWHAAVETTWGPVFSSLNRIICAGSQQNATKLIREKHLKEKSVGV